MVSINFFDRYVEKQLTFSSIDSCIATLTVNVKCCGIGSTADGINVMCGFRQTDSVPSETNRLTNKQQQEEYQLAS